MNNIAHTRLYLRGVSVLAVTDHSLEHLITFVLLEKISMGLLASICCDAD
jgi:hypothetical protein